MYQVYLGWGRLLLPIYLSSYCYIYQVYLGWRRLVLMCEAGADIKEWSKFPLHLLQASSLSTRGLPSPPATSLSTCGASSLSTCCRQRTPYY